MIQIAVVIIDNVSKYLILFLGDIKYENEAPTKRMARSIRNGFKLKILPTVRALKSIAFSKEDIVNQNTNMLFSLFFFNSLI